MTDKEDRRTNGVSSTSTSHAINTYLPESPSERRGVALCLSGGGYRASVFHLGALRRLNELGLLSQVDTVASVSGGSITSAFIAAYLLERQGVWPASGDVVADWEENFSEPLRSFVKTNIRTEAIFKRLSPAHWLDSNAGTNALAARIGEAATHCPIHDLPERPRFIFCATDNKFRSQWVIDSGKDRLGDVKAGYITPIPEEWTVALAAAVSACFPIAISPRKLNLNPDHLTGGTYKAKNRKDLVSKLDLSDGGVYDNLGVESVWQDHALVLVSDGGPSLSAEPPFGPFWSSLRHIVTLLEQVTELRKRWLISSMIRGDMQGAYWSIGSLPSSYERHPDVSVYPDDLIRDVISQVRIDLDAFTDAEIAVLENHGYAMVDLAIKQHLSAHITQPNATTQIPHPEYMNNFEKVATALANSGRYSPLGHGRWW